MLYVFRCPTFFEDGLEYQNKSRCVSTECPRSLTVLPVPGEKGNPTQKPRQAFTFMLQVHFCALFQSVFSVTLKKYKANAQD